MTEPVSVSFNANQTRAAFTLYHPKGNILTLEMVLALRAALDGVAENPHLKLITIEGAGKDFSFGASIPEHTAAQIGRVLPEMHALIYDLLDAPAPTAALVRGRCFGGGFELALACDMIFAESGSRFALPETALGVFPPAAAALLPHRAGAASASYAILTGEEMDASRWHALGLVPVLAGSGELQMTADQWFARHLAPKSAAALRHAAAAVRLGFVDHVRKLLPRLERLYLEDLMRTHDAVEGVDAFMAKRTPSWTDR
jgi:cyclohexa-1,5-dienecarbonyl-CoA hydratase